MGIKIGFIGSGNMARSMIKGLLVSEKAKKEDIFVSNTNQSSLDEIKALYDVNITTKNTDVSKKCDAIFLCVKPNKYKEVCFEIDDFIKDDAIIISIAPGQSINKVSSYFKNDISVISAMPNTPSKVLSAMSAICVSDKIPKHKQDYALSLFEAFGAAEIVDESLMNAVIAVSGSSPAFIFILIEAMADQAVAYGMSRTQAYKFAGNAVLGSAKMVLDDPSIHVAKLKDDVCSPKGTTIEGVLALENSGFRTSIQQAMQAVFEKAEQM